MPDLEAKYTKIIKSDDVNPKEVDAILAEELNRMSFDERETLYEEIHGVAPPIAETEEFLVESLRLMEEEIQKIKTKDAYDLAVSQSPQSYEYVSSPKFRLMFLRAQRFNASDAAAQLVKFMEGKLQLFGEECLGRQILYSDLDADDLVCLKAGVYQLLPKRDRAGRVVLAFMIKLLPDKFYKKVDNMGSHDVFDANPINTNFAQLRAFYFTMMSAVNDDEESQRNGWVSIMYFVGGNKLEFDVDLHTRTPQMADWLPFRLSATHFCSDDIVVRVFKALLVATMVRHVRVRLRIHDGTHTEIQYSLMTFGIPIDFLPVTYDGELKTANHLKWVARRKARDSKLMSEGKFKGVDLPTDKDVLLGRGRTFQDHSGNVRMRQLVGAHMSEYRAASKEGKVHVTMKVVQEVKALGGRFLQRKTDGWWIEVNDEDARKRVCMSVRTMLTSSKNADSITMTPSKHFIEHQQGKRARLSPDPQETPCFSLDRCKGGKNLGDLFT